jgi:hypothetical protein
MPLCKSETLGIINTTLFLGEYADSWTPYAKCGHNRLISPKYVISDKSVVRSFFFLLILDGTYSLKNSGDVST